MIVEQTVKMVEVKTFELTELTADELFALRHAVESAAFDCDFGAVYYKPLTDLRERITSFIRTLSP